jgi:short-subunit dehydrogenase
VERPLALITGASSGIGAAFARALASRGYSLILVARRKERLEALAGEINAEVLVADLTNDAELKRVEDRIAAAENLDLLVNNAGFGTLGRFWEADLDGQDRMHRLHVLATMRLTHAALRGMVARGSGAVINVASVAGFVQTPGSTSYGATKRWMNAFTEGLYLELKSAGSPVKVQALCPGFTYSEFHDVAGADRNLIAKSLWLRAEDVVAASLRGLDRGDLFVIPGWRYKFLVRLLAIVPDGLRRWGSLRYARRAKRA